MTERFYSLKALAVLYFVGIALLIFGFLTLVPAQLRANAAWLDFTVICIIYTINFPLFALWRTGSKSFTERIPQLSVFLFADPIYCSLALGIAYWGFVSQAPYRLQLIGQLALFFVASVLATVGWYGSEHVRSVAIEEAGTRSSLQRLKTSIAKCEVSLTGLNSEWERPRLRIVKIKEDARYLSPSSDPSLVDFEDELASAADEITRLAGTHNSTDMKSQIPPLLDRCEAVMSLRRQSVNH
jgi:hypothetical protein